MEIRLTLRPAVPCVKVGALDRTTNVCSPAKVFSQKITSNASRVRRLLALGLTCLLAGLAAPAFSAATPTSAAKTGEIVCTGAVRYQSGEGAWLTRENGTVSVGLPVGIKTDSTPCHLVIPNLGNFQANPDSEFVLTECGGGELALVVKRGTVLYSVNGGVTVNVTTPLPSGVSDGAIPPGVVGSVWPAFPKGQFSDDPTAQALDRAFQFQYVEGSTGAMTPASNGASAAVKEGKLHRWFAPVLRGLGLGQAKKPDFAPEVRQDAPFQGIVI